MKPGPINFKDPPNLEEIESGKEIESRERRWKAKNQLADLMRTYSAYTMCKTIVSQKIELNKKREHPWWDANIRK